MSIDKFTTKIDTNKSHLPLFINAHDRAKEYPNMHAEGNVLLCTICNVVIDHQRKSTIDDHLKSKKHLKRKVFDEQQTHKKQKTIGSCFDKMNTAKEENSKVSPK